MSKKLLKKLKKEWKKVMLLLGFEPTTYWVKSYVTDALASMATADIDYRLKS